METPVQEQPVRSAQTRQQIPSKPPRSRKSLLLFGILGAIVLIVLIAGAYILGMNTASKKPIVYESSPTPRPTVSVPQNTTSDWKTYTFTQQHISFKYPANYLVGLEAKKGFEEVAFATTQDEADGLKQCFIPGQKPTCPQYDLDVNVSTSSTSAFPTLQSFMSNSLQDTSFLKPTKFQGYDAYQGVNDSQNRFRKVVFVDTHGEYVMISLATNTNIDMNKKYVDQILSSFTFTQ